MIEKRRQTNALTLKIVGGVVAAVVLIGIIGAALGAGGDDSSGDTSKPVVASSATDDQTAGEEPSAPPSQSPTEKPEKTPSEKPAPPASPKEQLEAAIEDSDADNVHLKPWSGAGSWLVEFDVKDNLSRGLIQGGIAIDVFDMAERISDTGVPVKEVAFRGMFPLVDKFGNEKPGQVFFTTLRGSTMNKINYDNIDNTQVDLIKALAIGHIVVLHPDLQD
jgi:hypothetical protein